jgi:DMSO/TMAO reductase YedYZ molybdopterin-dependent catalytic subunit
VAVTAASGAALAAWEGGLALADAPGAHRRFTGSHEVGSGDPAAFPVTQWLDDRVQRLDAGSWRLETGGRRLTLAVLREMPQDDVAAVLDCTGGWWSEQQWRGVRLDRIVDLGDARSARVTSATGYSRLIPAADLRRTWLALECGGAPLSVGHGFPARLVAPGRRGFWWVKWVVSVEPSATPWWAQPPYPLT